MLVFSFEKCSDTNTVFCLKVICHTFCRCISMAKHSRFFLNLVNRAAIALSSNLNN